MQASNLLSSKAYAYLECTTSFAGLHLASSGDGGEVLVWEPLGSEAAAMGQQRRGNLEADEGEASWRRTAALKGHSASADVMDLCWSPDGSALASAALDAEVLVFGWGGRRRGEHAARLKNHKHFVQGVAWDPAQQYVVTQSADRTARCGCVAFHA
jgi:chromatin assembly factor 1 subunit B